MSADLEQFEAKLGELRSERDALLTARTKEAAAEAATAFLEGARRHAEGLGGLIVGGHAVGQPLDDVLRAFLLADPKLEPWLSEQAQQFAELTAKQRDSRLRKVSAEIAELEKRHLAARKAAALAQLEIEFAEVSSGEAA
jgi:hypothetical protein